MFKFVKICSRWLRSEYVLLYILSLHRIFVAKYKTSKHNFFTIGEWVSFFEVIYVLSTCRDNKLLVTE